MRNCLDTNNKALVVLGTNLGKSTTVLQYISSSNLNTIVLVPNIAIKTDWENRQKDYPNIISVMTYMEHSNKHNSIDYNNYSLVVCDEVHHIGADVWGSGVKELLENGNIKIIGITATNERTDGINIEDYFKGCTCFGDSVEDAIEKGILHPISYITSIYDTTGIKTEIDKYKAKVDPNDETSKALIGRLDIDVNSLNIKNTLTNPKYKMDGKRKGFVFIPDTTSEKKIRPILEDAYPDAAFRSINSNMDKKDIEENKNWFNSEEDSDKDKYLISINMVSEGVHYKGINTLIMFRSTKSHLVYTQQLGRVLTLSKFENPNAIVFDLVNNIDYVDYNYSIKKGRTILGALKSVQKRKKSKQIIVADETRDIVKDLRKLKQVTSNDWEDWEDKFLFNNYEKLGTMACTKKLNEEWERLGYPKNKRTIGSVHSHATRYLGLNSLYSKVYKIDRETLKIVKEYKSIVEAGKDGYSGGVIGCCQRKYKTSSGYYWCYSSDYNDNWTPPECKYERNRKIYCYNNGKTYNSIKEASKDLNINHSKISRVCNGKETHTNGFQFCWATEANTHVWADISNYTKPTEWTNEQIDYLKNSSYIETGVTSEIIKNLCPHTKDEIMRKARKLGLLIIQGPLHYKSVYCVELDKTFSSMLEAASRVGLNDISGICGVLNGTKKTAGGYHWLRSKNELTDNLKTLVGTQIKQRTITTNKKVMCIETNAVFGSMVAAADYCGIKVASNIRSAIKRNGTAGGYHWKYVEEDKDEI